MYVKHEDIHQKSEHISVLESELSQRGINILHRADVYQVFHKHTRLISEPPGGRPLPSSQKHLEASGEQGPRWMAGPADRPASCWRRGPSRGCGREGNRIPQEPRHPGQEAELPFALSSPSAKRRSEKPGGNEQLWEETSVRLRAERPTGSPLWGRRAEGPEAPRQLDVNSAAWKEGGHWLGGRGSAPPAAELRAAPSFLWTASLRSTPTCISALSPPMDERHPRVLAAHPGHFWDWGASRPRRAAAGSAESPATGCLPQAHLPRQPHQPPCVQKLSWTEAGHRKVTLSWEHPPQTW